MTRPSLSLTWTIGQASSHPGFGMFFFWSICPGLLPLCQGRGYFFVEDRRLMEKYWRRDAEGGRVNTRMCYCTGYFEVWLMAWVENLLWKGHVNSISELSCWWKGEELSLWIDKFLNIQTEHLWAPNRILYLIPCYQWRDPMWGDRRHMVLGRRRPLSECLHWVSQTQVGRTRDWSMERTEVEHERYVIPLQ
jgi:hypothetical protein